MFKLLIIANNNLGDGISGGDTIWLNFVKYWKKKIKISLLASQDAINLMNRKKIKGVDVVRTDRANNKVGHYQSLALFWHGLRRSYKGLKMIWRHRQKWKKVDFVYSVSDFWPDFWPALLLKIYRPSIKWLAGCYLIAPRPWSRLSPYKSKHKLKAWFFYLSQLVSIFFIKGWADVVLVTSKTEKKAFRNKKVVVVRGGVDFIPSKKWLGKKKYQACFMGRFHFQKGVLKMIDIWKEVVKKRKRAKLAMIGDGQLKRKVENKIKKLGLEKNIDLLGFKYGMDKIEVFKTSCLVVHPATYDSGGMSMAEIMAGGIPGVCFDLKSLKSYYPQGVLKANCFDVKDFARKIDSLLSRPELYGRLSEQAVNLIRERWAWPRRAEQIYRQIFS
ncbi:hypothetical protein DRH14_00800 [Candidatus Shapirobacteria bacterium]|nr:MAG: hypothetical protein DRH14_00800 [Candidatus Shapirobacteria bacterium]